MRIVAMVTSVFATAWWTAGIWASHASAPLYCVPLVVSAVIIGTAFRQKRNIAAPIAAGRRIGRVVGIASAGEGIAILAAFAFLPNMQQIDFVVSVYAVIVGLHFIPLARWLPARVHYVTAALLIGLGISGFAIGNADLHVQYVCLGAAGTLWLSYAMAITTGYRRCPSIPSGATCS
jgi:hypothetical protein